MPAAFQALEVRLELAERHVERARRLAGGGIVVAATLRSSLEPVGRGSKLARRRSGGLALGRIAKEEVHAEGRDEVDVLEMEWKSVGGDLYRHVWAVGQR